MKPSIKLQGKGKRVVRRVGYSSLDSYHYHEVLDRAFVALDHWNEYITQHPVVIKHCKLRLACECAEDAMMRVYQIAATVEDENLAEVQNAQVKRP